ncbi:MAG: hypothetical protein H7Z38_19360 [Rubrivivax sp.]|nr:hypothetical protein [Pyrinomonadaceae bacterium]
MSDEREQTEDEGAGDVSRAASEAEPEAAILAFEVSEADADTRLDAFLASRIEGVSRTTLKRSIEDGDALVDGHAAKPSYKLRAGERVEVELPEPPTSDLTPEDIPLDIVHEDDHIVVVNKRAGMVVHPASGVLAGTLANALAFRFAQLRIADCGLRIEEETAQALNPKSAIHNRERCE